MQQERAGAHPNGNGGDQHTVRHPDWHTGDGDDSDDALLLEGDNDDDEMLRIDDLLMAQQMEESELARQLEVSLEENVLVQQLEASQLMQLDVQLTEEAQHAMDLRLIAQLEGNHGTV